MGGMFKLGLSDMWADSLYFLTFASFQWSSVYTVSHVTDRCYIGKTSRPLEVRFKEHKCNLTQGLLEKSKLAQDLYEEGHKICWNEAKVLQIEPNTTYRKHS
jgi:hypothetical protein